MSAVPFGALADADELLARAHAMEVEAADRYEEFAAQMELHRNLDVAALFRKLARIERAHADEMAAELARRPRGRAGEAPLAGPGREALESASGEALHYLMTPYHALQIALENEERALAFFAGLAQSAASSAVRDLADRLAQEEKRHVDLVRAWLADLPKPSADWAYDPDEPRMPD